MSTFLKPHFITDYYKTGHIHQMPKDTNFLYANYTARSSTYSNVPSELFDNKIVNFGLQYFIKWFLIKLWNENFFNKDKETIVKEYEKRLRTNVSSNYPSAKHIADLHDLGYLPLEIKTIKEGQLVDIRVPILSIKNTHPDFAWLVTYIEPALSVEMWHPITSATTAYYFRQLLLKYAKETNVDVSFVDFQGHDFSLRGHTSIISAIKSAAAHCLSFIGTDTISAEDFLLEYYHAGMHKGLICASVPATEHNVTTLRGLENEKQFIKELISEIYPEGIVSIVSDTWDYFAVLEYMCSDDLKQLVINRGNDKVFSRVVIRPDSGDPFEIVCGKNTKVVKVDSVGQLLGYSNIGVDIVEYNQKLYKLDNEKIQDNIYDLVQSSIKIEQMIIEGYIIEYDYSLEYSDMEWKGSIEYLWEHYGGTVDKDGYKHLNSKIGLIYGDGINFDNGTKILEGLKQKGFATDCIVFGIGSYTYQYVTRDTYGFAFKCTYGEVGGNPVNMVKNPKTDLNNVKKSASGLLKVEKDDDNYVLVQNVSEDEEQSGELITVFKDGQLIKEFKYSDIIENVRK